MDCVLVAGGRPEPDDPLYPETLGKPKALLEINGRPIIDFVLCTLLNSQSIHHIVLVGLDTNIGQYPEDRVTFIADQGDLVANGLAGLAQVRQRRPETKHTLFCSADIPAIRSSHVESLIAACHPFDRSAYYFMVKRQVMEELFPDSKRTYIWLEGVQAAGADIFVADADLADRNPRLLHVMAAGRKKPWKLARIVGLTTLITLWSRRLTLTGIENRAETVIHAPVSVQFIQHPQLAMDVDKPGQLASLRQYLAGDVARGY